MCKGTNKLNHMQLEVTDAVEARKQLRWGWGEGTYGKSRVLLMGAELRDVQI